MGKHEKIIALLTASALAFAAGIIFERQIGVGSVLIRLGVKKKAPPVGPYPPRLAALDALTIPEKRIIFMGDSLVCFEEWAEAFPVCGIVNRGVNGATLEDLTGRYDISKAKAVFSLVGINDVNNGATFEEFKTKYQKFVDSIPKGVNLYSISMPSVLFENKAGGVSLVEKCNECIRETTTKRGGVYLDIFQISKQDGAAFHVADGLHFSKEAYQKIIALLTPYVEKEAGYQIPQ
jgi:lysophospholipase L1-like esterase